MRSKSEVIIPSKITARNQTIDHLRGIGILVMIVTHALVPYLNDKYAYLIWNWSHFSVPVFIFCSASLFFAKHEKIPAHPGVYFIHRIQRLIKPYYLYLGFLIIFYYSIGQKISFDFLFKSLTISGGADISWLVLLFVVFSVLLPVLSLIRTKSSRLFYAFFIVSFLSSVLLLWYVPPIQYKWYFWLPWASIAGYAYIFPTVKKNAYILMIFTLFLTVGSFFILQTNNHSTMLFNNKYPPNLFYLSYGMTLVGILYYLSGYILNRVHKISQIISFFSKFSYEIFFIHYLLISIFVYLHIPSKISSPLFILVVLTVSSVMQISFNNLKMALHKGKIALVK